jgi:23S rRNA (adenine-N6)-dimethyltransferase
VLAERLRRRFALVPNVTVFLDDFLTFPLPLTRYKVFANVPFNITAGIVSRLTEATYPPEDAYLGVQREAAQRYLGLPHGPCETLVSAILKLGFEPSVTHCFARRDFVPEPGVDVVLLRLRKRGPPLLSATEIQRYRDVVTYAFTAWQPSVRRALTGVVDGRLAMATDERLRKAGGIGLDSRPSELPFEAWLALFRILEEGSTAWVRVAGAEERLRRQQAGLEKVHRTGIADRAKQGDPRLGRRPRSQREGRVQQ